MGNVLKSVISGWFAETDKANFVDKNRGWLRMAEMLNILKKLVHLSEGDLNTLFETLSDWENILQAEKNLLNNVVQDLSLIHISEPTRPY